MAREWHSIEAGKAVELLSSSAEKGLAQEEALKRLAENGKNAIETGKKVSVLQLLLEQFSSPLVLILLAAAGISYFFEKGIDAFLILAIVAANAVFGFIQNYNAEKSIEALRKMGAAKALCLRSGKLWEIHAEELVPGDIILLREGMKVPADARIIESGEATADESILTGESGTVSKKIEAIPEGTVLAERKSMLYMDTLIVRGKAKAIVVATGEETEVGKIAERLRSIGEEPTRFHREMADLGKKISAGILVLVAIILGTILFLHEAKLIDAIIISISVAVAAIPEGLPAVVTLSLAIATQKMLKRKSLVRKLPVLENLGSVDVICTDKTGTLTENSMTVQKIYCNENFFEVTGTGQSIEGEFLQAGKKINSAEILELNEVLLCGLLCNNTIIDGGAQPGFRGDPTEIALSVSGLKAGIQREGWREIREIPFSSSTRRMTTLMEKNGEKVSFAKGAPEVIIEACTHYASNGKAIKLDSGARQKILLANSAMASKALRVLAFARKEVKSEKEGIESGMVFLGLQGMIDPPRTEVAEALRTTRDAGIRVMMLTGDNEMTARAIGEKIGFSGKSIDGKRLGMLSKGEFEKAVFLHDIFARVSPEQKFEVLRVLKERGHSVAMTGDGVNDAPALKEADVGIAMGIRGTDVSKEASDIILLDDNFATIIEAIRFGRGAFENIQKFVNYLVSNNIAEVFIVFIASLAGYLSLTAPQLLWINLLTDGLPALALGVDEPRHGIMGEKPRRKGEEIISKKSGALMLLIGASLTIIVLAIFFSYLPRGIAYAQTMVFTALVFYEFIRIVVIKRQEEASVFANRWLVGSLGVSMALQIILLYTPASAWFGTVPLNAFDWLVLGLGAVIAYVASIAAMVIVQKGFAGKLGNTVSGN